MPELHRITPFLVTTCSSLGKSRFDRGLMSILSIVMNVLTSSFLRWMTGREKISEIRVSASSSFSTLSRYSSVMVGFLSFLRASSASYLQLFRASLRIFWIRLG